MRIGDIPNFEFLANARINNALTVSRYLRSEDQMAPMTGGHEIPIRQTHNFAPSENLGSLHGLAVLRRFETDFAIPLLVNLKCDDFDFATCPIEEQEVNRKRGIVTDAANCFRRCVWQSGVRSPVPTDCAGCDLSSKGSPTGMQARSPEGIRANRLRSLKLLAKKGIRPRLIQ